MFNNYTISKLQISISDNLTSFYQFLGTMVRFLKATEAENEANLYCTRGQWPPGWNVPDTTWSRPRTRLRPSWIPLSTQSPTHLAAITQWLSSTIMTKRLICFRLVLFWFFLNTYTSYLTDWKVIGNTYRLCRYGYYTGWQNGRNEGEPEHHFSVRLQNTVWAQQSKGSQDIRRRIWFVQKYIFRGEWKTLSFNSKKNVVKVNSDIILICLFLYGNHVLRNLKISETQN